MSKYSKNATFNFDLNEMENTLNSKKHRVPDISSDEAFDKWIDGDEEAFDDWVGKKKEPAFNYDLDEMKNALEGERIPFPEFNSLEEYEDWLDNLDIEEDKKNKAP